MGAKKVPPRQVNATPNLFTLAGLDAVPTLECTLGEVCTVSITGEGLTQDNEMAVFDAATPCGHYKPGV